MIFNFQILGLLIMFGLIGIYYISVTKKSEESIVYRTMLISTYITELLYVASYIAIRQNIKSIFFIKGYLIFITISFSLLALYYIVIGLKNKYLSRDSIYEKKLKLARTLFIFLNVITTVLILISKITLDDNIVTDQVINFTYLFTLIYTAINIISLVSYYKELPKKECYSLVLISIISTISIIVGYSLNKIPALNSGIVLIVLFIYILKENNLYKEMEILELERDHARENNVDRSKFLRNLSHELRTPLNTIDGFSQVIEDSDNIDSIKEDVKDIRLASKNLIDTINGIIDMAIIESGNLEILKENYNTNDMIENIITITKSRIKENDIKLITEIDKDIPKVLVGDSERIEQIVLSILNNSLNNTKKGTITLKVESIKSTSICRLKISITDNSTKLKEEDLNKIFENKDSNLNKYELGLRYSKKLLDLMDGKIDIESKEEATTFTITIDQKTANGEEVKKVERKTLKTFNASSKRILLVDDNKLNIKVATKLLEPYKVEITEATSGKECLDILEKDTSFDLILMDDLMPNMSGTETLDILRKIERVEGYSIPVVVLTANAISGMKNKYLSKGFDDYLAKPIDKYELNRVLKTFLKKDKED